MPETASPRPAKVFPPFRIPPPILFLIAFGLGLLLDLLLPFRLPHARLAGWIVLAAGILSGASLALRFRARQTTLNPFGKPSDFQATGPYRFSRNPMYLSLTLAYLGGVVLTGSFGALILLSLPLAIMDRVVIPVEETNLRETFGDTYTAYCGKVRRWL